MEDYVICIFGACIQFLLSFCQIKLIEPYSYGDGALFLNMFSTLVGIIIGTVLTLKGVLLVENTLISIFLIVDLTMIAFTVLALLFRP